jgi:hypothetical protein
VPVRHAKTSVLLFHSNMRSSTMKIVFISVVCVFLVIHTASSQVPNLITHNGYLVDSLGTPVSGNRPMTFRLYPDSTTSLADWSEAFPAVTMSNGVYSVNLDVTGVDFRTNYWLETQVGASVLAPRTRLTTVPYALLSSSLQLPYTASKGASSDVMSITQLNTEVAGAAIHATSLGSMALLAESPGFAGYFSASGLSPAVFVTASGTGEGAEIGITNPSNTSDALHVTTAGTGNGVYVKSSGGSYAVYAESGGPNGAVGVSTAPQGTGVTGRCDNGANAWGVYGTSLTGIGVLANGNDNSSSPNTALKINGGALAVGGTVKPAFVFETVVVSSGSSQINNALSDGDPNAILVVTPRQDTPTVPAVDVYVLYSSGHWYMHSPSLTPGMRYNILVIKQL